jgi:hypothetical protein
LQLRFNGGRTKWVHDAVLKIAKDLRNAEIRVSVIWVFDPMDQNDCMGWPLWTCGYYGPIGQFTEALHKLGFKVLTYIDPYVRSVLIPYPLCECPQKVLDNCYACSLELREVCKTV